MNGHRVRSALVVAAAVAAGASASQAASPALIVFSADRAPFLSGEIYRIDSTGTSVDLSNDTAAVDTSPVVSPDGKHVAFLSNRSGQEGTYEIGIDGSGLVQVAPTVSVSEGAQLAWQPHGGLLAVATSSGVWIVAPGHGPVRVPHATGLDGWVNLSSINQVPGWSPDGRRLAVTVPARHGYSNRELVFSARGHRLWQVRGLVGPWGATWSPHGLLAVPVGGDRAGARHSVAVYGKAGRLRFTVRLGLPTPWAYWSPNGSRVAITSGHSLQVRTAVGRLLLRKGLKNHVGWGDLMWVGNHRVVIGVYSSCACHAVGIDVRTGKMSRASGRFDAPTSPDQKLALLRVPAGDEFEIQVAPTAGGPPQSYGHVPACESVDGARYADFGPVQFVPHRDSLVYASACSSPKTSLYSVAPGGGPVRRITAAGAMYWSPALSPDGSKIAYVTNRCAGLGCSSVTSSIGVLNAEGSGEHLLHTPVRSSPTCSGDYDESPTWSPDGATILFGTTTCNSGTGMPELYTVPASGGAAHDLGFRGYQATWGPSRIAYVGDAPSNAPSGTFIWTAKPDGTDPIPVAGSSGASSPAWSPNGQLAYLRNTSRKVVVGSSESTFPFASVLALAWSPDGTRLVVSARATATAPPDLYSVNPNGSDPIRLTQNYDTGGVTWR